MMPTFMPLLDEGFARSGGARSLADFQIWSHVDVLVDDDVRAAMRPFKEYVVTWSQMQRPFMEASGYTDLADRLAELIEAGGGEDAEARVQAGGNLLEGRLLGGGARRGARRLHRRGLARRSCRADPRRGGPVARLRAHRLGGPLRTATGHDEVHENLDAFRAIAEAAGTVPAKA